ncbi:MAG: glycosyltransferase [Akkermansiaceae bacterium]|nr:glycosyltransferase [Akkermansiaceae bacterium]
MRVLIVAIGSAGDVHPFLGIGSAMKSRGHEVILITSPYFEQAARKCGLGFHPLGTWEDFQSLQSDADLWHPQKGPWVVLKKATAPTYQPILDISRELHVPGETVLLGSSLAFGGLNVRDLLGIPMVSVHLSPALFVSAYRQPIIHGIVFGQSAPRFLKALQWKIASKIVDRIAAPDLNRFRSLHGLPPIHDLLRRGWHSPDRVLALFPEWFAAPQPDWPEQTRLTGFPLFDEAGLREVPEEVEAFLSSGDPPVIFTPGSAMAHGHAFFRESVKALTRSGRRGILLTPFKDSVPGQLPDNVRHFSYIPFSKVLPRAAAIVYHGGIGTCSQALRAGIPHLIQPMAHDQHETLSRIRDLGVGLGLPPSKFNDKRITATLNELLEKREFRDRARDIAKNFEVERWIRETCEAIEALLPEPPSGTPRASIL